MGRRGARSTSRSPPPTWCSAGEPVVYGLCRPPGPPRADRGVRRLLLLQQRGHRRPSLAVGDRDSASTVLDVDYHHGNGTQQIFYRRGDVQYVSFHGDPEPRVPVLRRLRGRDRRRPGCGLDPQPPAPGRHRRRRVPRRPRTGDRGRRPFGPGAVVVSLGVDTFGSTRSPTSPSRPAASAQGGAGGRARAADGRRAGGRLPPADDRGERARLAARLRGRSPRERVSVGPDVSGGRCPRGRRRPRRGPTRTASGRCRG